jgi:zinc transporter 1
MIALTGSMFLAEIITAYFTSSLALLSDSFHMLTDLIALIVAAIAIKYVDKHTPNPKLTFGWQRAEILAANANAVFLLALVFVIFVQSIQRFISPEHIDDPLLVLGVGVAGLIINALGLLLFHQHSHAHNSRESQKDTKDTISTHSGANSHKHSLNIHGVFLHLLGDFLGSIAVIFSSLCVYFAPNSTWSQYMDPLASFLMSILIALSAIPLVKATSKILLQASKLDVSGIKQNIEALEGVIAVHELHVWELSDNKTIASVHVLLSSNVEYLQVCQSVKELLHEYGVHSTTIQPEFVGDLARSMTPPDSCLIPCRGKAKEGEELGMNCIEQKCCTL